MVTAHPLFFFPEDTPKTKEPGFQKVLVRNNFCASLGNTAIWPVPSFWYLKSISEATSPALVGKHQLLLPLLLLGV